MHSRIGKPDDVREVEDEGEDHDRNEAVEKHAGKNFVERREGAEFEGREGAGKSRDASREMGKSNESQGTEIAEGG